MRVSTMKTCTRSLALLFTLLMAGFSHGADLPAPEFLTKMAEFPKEEAAAGIEGIAAKLAYRAKAEPFLLVATVIFVLAILHTFVALPITRLAHETQHKHDARVRKELGKAKAHDMVSFKATMLHFFGEVEAIFGIWVIALLGAILWFYDLATI